MSLETRINQDLKAAMKAKDKVAMRAIRAIKQAILLAKTDGSGTEIDETKELKMLQKLANQRKESLKIYEEQNREDLAVIEREELEVIAKYLPQPLSPEELEKEITSIVEETGASGMKDMGKVMGIASKKLAGRAEGKEISAIVRQLLNN
jgi:uncharacterized protein YqeY